MNPPIATQLARVLLPLAMWFAIAVEAAASGLVYEIRRDEAMVGFLVGTMHSEDPRVMQLLPTIRPLLARVDTLAVELIPDAVTMVAIAAASMLPHGQRLEDLIGSERYAALEEAAAGLDVPGSTLVRLRPWAAALTLATPPPKSGVFLDSALYLEAVERGKQAIGLESAAEQLAVFQQMPLSEQLQLLDEMIKNAADLPLQLEQLTVAYLSGDPDRLAAVVREQQANTSAAIAAWFDEVLLSRRNERMHQRILPLLAEGPVLIAVGAMHLLGDDGLVRSLRGDGYAVELWRP
ncbi:MAG: TraB/GumN family protein [Gammaproteobacteria bacterium]|nr:TraB/GumN family protein [Gammaproteobacteria bacterium]